MRIGIFGGTFDPPHLGHMILACEAFYQASLDRLLFVLTPDPPHKQGKPISPLRDRLDMLQAVLADDPTFELSGIEIDRAGPHYALDTVRLLAKQFPGADLIYLMGGDSLQDLPTWHRPQEFVAACHEIGVMRRPGESIDLAGVEAAIPGLTKKVRFIDAPLLEIASQQIRSRVAEGLPYRYYVTPSVYRIIEGRRLYRNSDNRP